MSDIYRSFPELNGFDRKQAEKIRKDTQKRITRSPFIFIGFILTICIVGAMIFKFEPGISILGPGLLGTLFDCVLIGATAAAYLKLIIEPKMREEFKRMRPERN